MPSLKVIIFGVFGMTLSNVDTNFIINRLIKFKAKAVSTFKFIKKNEYLFECKFCYPSFFDISKVFDLIHFFALISK